MSEVYLVASSQREGLPTEENVAQSALRDALSQTGSSSKRLSELHWVGQPTPLDDLPLTLPTLCWPDAPLLDTLALHNAARAVQLEERTLVLLGQSAHSREEDDPQPAGITYAAAVLLAAPQAVGRYNLVPRARLVARFSLTGSLDSLPALAQAAIEKQSKIAADTAQRRLEAKTAAQIEPDDEDLPTAFPTAETLDWLACAQPLSIETVQEVYPHARRLLALPPAPRGDIFLLVALMRALQHSRGRWGLLLSPGDHPTALATLIERL